MKYALILGSTSDIGKHIALGLGKLSYNLYLTGRNESLLRTIKNQILSASTVEVTALFLDITNFSSHQNFYEGLEIKPEIVFCCWVIMKIKKRPGKLLPNS